MILRRWERLTLGHPETEIFVFCLITLPFCAVIAVGMTSDCLHRLPFAVSAEFGPVGSLSSKLDTGTSGTVAKLEVVMPFVMFVLPTRITVTPSPLSTRSRSGNAAPPCETKIAGPVSLSGSTGVVTTASPTRELEGQASGAALNVACRQAWLSVLRREGSCL